MNNFGEKVSFIWSVADLLRGPYRPNQYKDVILPLTVLRRLDCVLESTKEELSGEIGTVYRKMQKVDRRLRGKGNPESVPKRDVSCKIKEMNNLLDRQIGIYKDLSFQLPEGWFKKWYNKSPHVKWLIGIVISILALIVSAVAVIYVIFAKN